MNGSMLKALIFLPLKWVSVDGQYAGLSRLYPYTGGQRSTANDFFGAGVAIYGYQHLCMHSNQSL